MKIPRIFAQEEDVVAFPSVGGVVPANQQDFRNDGDYSAFIYDFLLTNSVNGYWIRPTNGPMWSRTHVPASVLINENNRGTDGGAQARIRLYYPYPMNPHDALDISILDIAGFGGSLPGFSAIAYKDTEVKACPAKFMAPRVLYGRVTIADAALETVDIELLRNWGDYPMEVHAISIKPMSIDFDDFSVRIHEGKWAWTKDDRLLPISTLRNSWTGMIHIPKTIVPDDAVFHIQIQNNSGGPIDFDVAVIGYVEVS